MEFETGHELENRIAAQPDVSPNVPQGVSGFLAWLMLWLRLCVERSHSQSRKTARRTYQPNRYWRRRSEHSIPPTRDNRPYYIFSRRDLTPTQFMERLVALSGRGRVRVYRMRYWRKTVKGKAAPLGTEHEYWRDPLGRIGKRMGRLPVGVWHGHIWPGWRVLFFALNILPPVRASRVGKYPCPHVVISPLYRASSRFYASQFSASRSPVFFRFRFLTARKRLGCRGLLGCGWGMRSRRRLLCRRSVRWFPSRSIHNHCPATD